MTLSVTSSNWLLVPLTKTWSPFCDWRTETFARCLLLRHLPRLSAFSYLSGTISVFVWIAKLILFLADSQFLDLSWGLKRFPIHGARVFTKAKPLGSHPLSFQSLCGVYAPEIHCKSWTLCCSRASCLIVAAFARQISSRAARQRTQFWAGAKEWSGEG